MKIQELIQKHPSINITVDVSDLLEFGEEIASNVAKTILSNSEEKFYTRTEVLQRFDICSATLWRWDKQGIITGKKIGNRRYYPESEIKRLMSEEGGAK